MRTEIPGPRSRQLMARRSAAIPAGVGTTLGVFVARAAGGIVEDVDGNRLIDLASGISVTNVGNSAPRVVAAVSEQAGRALHPHLLPGDAVLGLRRGVRAPQPV